jgi:hypothetical protein
MCSSPPLGFRQTDSPVTPRHLKNGAALNALIRSIEAEHHFGLQVHGLRSPNTNLDKPLRDIVYGQIQQCYWFSSPALDKILSDFRNEAINLDQEEKLKRLHMKLKEFTATPRSVRTTNMQSPQHNPPNSLGSKSCKCFVHV